MSKEGIPIDIMEVLKNMGGVEIDIPEEQEEAPLEPVEREQFMVFIHGNFKEGLKQLQLVQKKKRNLEAQVFNTETQEDNILGELGELQSLERDVLWHEANGYRASFFLSDDGAFQVEYDLKERAGFKTPSADERTT